MAAPTKDDIVRVYRRRARQYDLAMRLYRIFGFPYDRARREAVGELGLSPGDVVVELGCGTGANLSLLHDAVGPAGRVVGVDMTDGMLEEARRRIERNGWRNVELVEADIAGFEFPGRVDGTLSTFALTMVPEYDAVVERGAKALSRGGRFVVLDLKEPSRWPAWMLKLALMTLKPFDVALEYGRRRPWESLGRHMSRMRMRELYLGAAFIAVGEVAQGRARRSIVREACVRRRRPTRA